MVNMERHIKNITDVYGLPCIVCLNHFTLDTDAEVDMLIKRCESLGVKAVVSKHWAQGGAGAEELATLVVDIVDNNPGTHQFTYEDNDSLWEKIEKISTKVYGAASISADPKVKKQLDDWNEEYGSYPICIAKTQMSFSTDPTVTGAPTDHNVHITEVRLANGAGFIVAIAGNMMTMPGLPKVPAAERIDIDDDGNISGLF